MFDTIIDILLFIPRTVFGWLMDGIAFFVESIPSPDFLQSLNFSAFSSGDLAFWVGFLQLDWGIALIFSALIARFILRRIPFIG